MKKYKVGDKSKAICPKCWMVATTFLTRDIKTTKTDIKNVLCGVCDSCGLIVSTPAQTTIDIKREWC